MCTPHADDSIPASSSCALTDFTERGLDEPNAAGTGSPGNLGARPDPEFTILVDDRGAARHRRDCGSLRRLRIQVDFKSRISLEGRIALVFWNHGVLWRNPCVTGADSVYRTISQKVWRGLHDHVVA